MSLTFDMTQQAFVKAMQTGNACEQILPIVVVRLLAIALMVTDWRHPQGQTAMLPVLNNYRHSLNRFANPALGISAMPDWSTSTNSRLKHSASMEKAEVQAKVEAKMKNVRFSLNLDLDLLQSGVCCGRKNVFKL